MKCWMHYFICKRLVKSVSGRAVILVFVQAFTVNSEGNYEEHSWLVPLKVTS
jgi:hypothetical protein